MEEVRKLQGHKDGISISPRPAGRAASVCRRFALKTMASLKNTKFLKDSCISRLLFRRCLACEEHLLNPLYIYILCT